MQPFSTDSGRFTLNPIDRLKPNQQVSITVDNKDGAPPFQSGAMVTNVGSDGGLEVCLFKRPRPEQLGAGEFVFVEFPVLNGVQRFQAVVKDVISNFGPDKRPLPLVQMFSMGMQETVERRKFFRVDVSLSAKFRLLTSRKGTRGSNAEPISMNAEQPESIFDCIGEIVDLGGGGIGLRTTTNLEEEHKILLELPLPEKNLEVMGMVVSIREDQGENSVFRYGIKFESVDPKDEADIVRFTFQEDIRRLREEMEGAGETFPAGEEIMKAG